MARRVCTFALSVVVLGGLAAHHAFPQSTNPSPNPFPADTPSGSVAATDLRIAGPSPDGWLFPITRLNELLPHWIQFGGQFRNRAESQIGLGYAPIDDAYDLTQLRLGIYFKLTKWLELVGVTQDSRVFFNHHVPNAPSYQNIWDIREAYARFGNSTEGWIDLVAGRQMFSFGDERVIGPSDWTNMGRTFDTIRLDLHPSGVKVSIFAASVINAVDGQIDHHVQGNNVYGIYSSFAHLIPHATLEPYVLWRVAPGRVPLPETAGRGHLSEVTGGARVAGTLLGDFDYDIEMNKQAGSLGHYSIDAWAGHWNAGYTFKNVHTHPRPFVEYNYASGNRNPNGNTWSTHDQIYASAHDKMDFADQFGWKNIEDLRAGASEKVAAKWTLTEILNDLWLATKNDAVFGSSGAIAVPAHPGATSNHLGVELDLIAEYKQNHHVTCGMGLAHLFTGRFLNEAAHGKDYNYPFAYVTYGF
jgi:Alginate export